MAQQTVIGCFRVKCGRFLIRKLIGLHGDDEKVRSTSLATRFVIHHKICCLQSEEELETT